MYPYISSAISRYIPHLYPFLSHTISNHIPPFRVNDVQCAVRAYAK